MDRIEALQLEIDRVYELGTKANDKAIAAIESGKTDDYEASRADVEKYIAINKSQREQMNMLREEEKAKEKVSGLGKPAGEPVSGEDHKTRTGSAPDPDDPAIQDEYAQLVRKTHVPWARNVVNSAGFKSVAKKATFDPRDTYHVKIGGFGHYVSDVNTSVQHLRKALYTTGGDEGQGGVFIEPVQSPRILDRVLIDRAFGILDALRIEQTTADIIEYYTLNSETNNADIVREWDTDEVPPNFGISPESDMDFSKEEMSMKEIRTHVRASDKALRDVPRLRGLIENRLRYFVRAKLESEVLNGDGTGDHFMGLMNWPGISNRTHKVSARSTVNDTIPDTIALALTDITLAGFDPNLILAHPYLLEKLRLLKDSTNNYLDIYDRVRNSVWNVPFAISSRMPSYTAIAGDFNIGATLYDRMSSEISVGQPGDLFLRRAWAVMAVLMAGFVVEYPTSMERILALNT